jgi:hypothetical protein
VRDGQALTWGNMYRIVTAEVSTLEEIGQALQVM